MADALAGAGKSAPARRGEPVILDGSASSDREEQPLTYAWRQTSGTPVMLTSTTAESPTFTAPELPMGASTEDLVFELVVNDGVNDSNPETVTVTISDTPPPVPGPITGPNSSINGAYTLSWGPSDSDTHYELQERMNGGPWLTGPTVTTNSTSYSVSGKRTGIYDYRVRACTSSICSGWTAVKTVDVTIPPTAGFDETYIIRTGDLGMDGDTDIYLSPLAIGTGNVGEFILENESGTFELNNTPDTMDLAAAQQWTESTSLELRVGDINMDGVRDAYVKGITGSISDAVDQFVISSIVSRGVPAITDCS